MTRKSGGLWMILEPFRWRSNGGQPQFGRPHILFGIDQICVPASLSQEVGLALGAQAGEPRLQEVILSGECSRLRRHCHPVQSGAGGALLSVT
jgi:hypothetical protein